MAQQSINPGSAPIIWSDVASAFDTINDNFTELYASVGGDAVDFTSLGTNLVPRNTELYDLGTSSKRWRDIWLSGSSIHLGDAVITSTGTTVNLPVGSTIGGLRVDESYFKYIAVDGQDSIEADEGTDTLTLASGNSGITLTTDADTDTLTITNSGVTSVNGTAGQIGVSQSTGGVTLTNLGVTSATAGQGINLNAGTGSVTITNSGVVGLDAGIGIQLSARDPVTGIVTITNSQPNIPQQVFGIIAVPTQTPIAADSTGDTLTIEVSGDGLSITTAPLTDTLTFTNTGVTSLAVGSGLIIDAGTGSINLTLDATLSRNIVGDITGSVFADDSTKLVDAVEGLIVGNIDTGRLRTSESKIALGTSAGATNQGADTVAVGNLAGRTNQATNGVAIGALSGVTDQGLFATAVGSGSGNTRQGGNAVAVGYAAGQADQGISAIAIGNSSGSVNQGISAIAIGHNAGPSNQGDYAIALGYNAGNGGSFANSIILNASGSLLSSSAAGFYVNPIRNVDGGAFLNYNATTKEIGYSNDLRSDQQISITVSGEDSTPKTWYFGNDGYLEIPPAGEINNAIGDDPDVNNNITINGFVFQNSTSLDPRGIYDNLGYNKNVQLLTVGAWVMSAADDIRIEAGTNLGGAGNNVTILAGNGSNDDPFDPGVGPGRNGGDVNISAGDTESGTTLGHGGNVRLTGGDGSSGGHIYLTGGDVPDDGTNSGNIIVRSGSNIWTFSNDGGLKIAGDIKSENNINIDINLADSTLRRWEFGEDGIFNTAGSIKLPENSSVFFGDAGATITNDEFGLNIQALGVDKVLAITASGNVDITALTVGITATSGLNIYGGDGDLNIGNDYFKIENGGLAGSVIEDDGSISILTDRVNNLAGPFVFGTDNTLTFPDSSIQTGAAISIADLKTLVAASTDFADFQSRIAAL